MLHFPNTTDRIEMLNYSDMTRKYRLYDETGKYDNVGNILVWPTQAQYNRSFNQALAGLTWWSWKENLDDSNNPEQAFAGGDILNGESGWVAGSGDKNANHEAMFAMAAKNDGFSEKFIEEYGNNNPHNFFDGSEGKGGFDAEESPEMKEWDAQITDSKVNRRRDGTTEYELTIRRRTEISYDEMKSFMESRPEILSASNSPMR
jgi:hypothetical protein